MTLQQVRDAWPEILKRVEGAKRSAWSVVYTSKVRSLAGDVLTVVFANESDAASFRERGAGDSVSEHLRRAILDVLGIRVKFIAKVEPSRPAADAAGGSAAPEPDEPAPVQPAAAGWAVVPIPTPDAAANDDDDEPERGVSGASDAGQRRGVSEAGQARGASEDVRAPGMNDNGQARDVSDPGQARGASGGAQVRGASVAETTRYGEAVVREVLGASFIGEHKLEAPRAPGMDA